MNIWINKEENIFHLQNKKISYVMQVLKDGSLALVYFGKKISNQNDFSDILKFPWRGNLTNPIDNDPSFTLEDAKLEFPTFGFSEFEKPILEVTDGKNILVTKFIFEEAYTTEYSSYEKDLPHFRDIENQTLVIVLKDTVNNIRIKLFYTLIDDKAAIAKNYEIINESDSNLFLTTALSGNFDFEKNQFEIATLQGAWIRERKPSFQLIKEGNFSIASRRGTSSHHQNPFFAIAKEKINNEFGEVYGFGLVYSGNFLAELNNNTFNRTRVRMGINPDGFNYELKPNETFETPQILSLYSSNGLDELSNVSHKVIKNHLINKKFLTERPIIINNWEATYFDFDEKTITSLAEKAKNIGVEMFVLDDGWFGDRYNETTSLGDWFINEKKLPQGLNHLAKQIIDLGLKFGIWIEPEMISPKSVLFEEHPEWFIGGTDQGYTLARDQLILDFSNDEIVQYIFEMLKKVFKTIDLSYIKWDMNRYISEATSFSIENQGNLYHDYVKGVYKLYQLLTDEFPDVIIEGCASGGGRFDMGILYYSPQIWASDNMDAMCRLQIQKGTSFFFPQCTMGAHVGSFPGHQVGRSNPLWTSFSVAMFGVFGYETNLLKLDDKTLDTYKQQIEFYKQHRNTLLYGDFYRTFENENLTVWQVEDADKLIVAAVQKLTLPNDKNYTVKLKNCDNNCTYVETTNGNEYTGDFLGNVGLNLNNIFNHHFSDEERGEMFYQPNNLGQIDFSSKIFVFEKKA